MKKIILFFNFLAFAALVFVLVNIFEVWAKSVWAESVWAESKYVSLFDTAEAILVTLIAPLWVFMVFLFSFALHKSNDASGLQRIMPVMILFLLVQSWLFHGTPWLSLCLALLVCAVSAAWMKSVYQYLK